MSKITALEGIRFIYALPPGKQLPWAGGLIKQRDCVFIKVTAADGRVGWGEIGEVYFYPELYVAVINGRVRDFLLGKDAGNTARINRELQVFLLPLGYSGLARAVISGVDIALNNLNAAASGGKVEVPVYASTGFGRDLAEMLAECRRAMDMGFRNIKIRGGISVSNDVARVRAAREHLGAGIGLILDLSQPYSFSPYTFTQVAEICRKVQPYDLLWVEEPFWPEDLDSYQRLQNAGTVRIGCGENLYTEEQFKAFGEVVDVLQPDVTRVGGMAALAGVSRYGRKIAPHQFGTSVALYHLCRSIGRIKNFYLLELDLMPNPIREAIGMDLRIVDGVLVVDSVAIEDLGPALAGSRNMRAS